jgi:hypothetical protein
MLTRVEQIAIYGNFSVWKRMWNEPGLRKYVVYRESDGKALEEFRTPAAALRWAKLQAKANPEIERSKDYERNEATT